MVGRKRGCPSRPAPVKFAHASRLDDAPSLDKATDGRQSEAARARGEDSVTTLPPSWDTIAYIQYNCRRSLTDQLASSVSSSMEAYRRLRTCILEQPHIHASDRYHTDPSTQPTTSLADTFLLSFVCITVAVARVQGAASIKYMNRPYTSRPQISRLQLPSPSLPPQPPPPRSACGAPA